MNCRCAVAGSLLFGLLSLAPGLAQCSGLGERPLQLQLAASPVSELHDKAGQEVHAGAAIRRASTSRRGPGFTQVEPSLRQRALQSVLNAPEQGSDDAGSGTGQPTSTDRFRFERQGSAFRNLSRGYQDMCATVTNKVWDEPNGRRIKFDIAGKPGVAVEIPLR